MKKTFLTVAVSATLLMASAQSYSEDSNTERTEQPVEISLITDLENIDDRSYVKPTIALTYDVIRFHIKHDQNLPNEIDRELTLKYFDLITKKNQLSNRHALLSEYLENAESGDKADLEKLITAEATLYTKVYMDFITDLVKFDSAESIEYNSSRVEKTLAAMSDYIQNITQNKLEETTQEYLTTNPDKAEYYGLKVAK